MSRELELFKNEASIARKLLLACLSGDVTDRVAVNNPFVAAMDPVGAHIYNVTGSKLLLEDAATDAVSSFNDRNLETVLGEHSTTAQTGDASPDNADFYIGIYFQRRSDFLEVCQQIDLSWLDIWQETQKVKLQLQLPILEIEVGRPQYSLYYQRAP
jgi:hypothetical protein